MLPFGAMLSSSKASLAEYKQLAQEFDAAATSGDVADRLAAKIRQFIADKWQVPSVVVASIQCDPRPQCLRRQETTPCVCRWTEAEGVW